MTPIPMILTCPRCTGVHIDVGDFATKSHHTHACQLCGMVWRPALMPTVGVRFLPGFKNDPDAKDAEREVTDDELRYSLRMALNEIERAL